jgi:hypothetical protein
MTGKEFYETFKEALDYVGVGFIGKDQVEVTLTANEIAVSANGRTVIIDVPEYMKAGALN